MNSEAILQQTTIAMIRTLYPDLLISLSMSGVSLNGTAKENALTIQSLVAQGFERGLPDIVLYLPDRKLLNLEFKRPNGGKQSPDQIAVQNKLKLLKHNYHLVRDPYTVFALIVADTTYEFRQQSFDSLVIPSDGVVTTTQFLHWPIGTGLTEIYATLHKLYGL